MLKKEGNINYCYNKEQKTETHKMEKSGVVPFLPVLFLVSNWHHVHKLQTSVYSLQHFETLSPMHLESKEKPQEIIFMKCLFIKVNL